ncbi:neprosin family prolyl endopeptidase [Kitasatospora arboriphila]|uniref:Neprosin PEP catalytic domain-containing protein n=1 Tax=Kitasatospora arboriphila TaxID=258052 RepID=A0ABN1U1Y8_9ACTN
MAPQDGTNFPSFAQFIDDVASARHDEFTRRSRSATAGEDEFAAMRQHILGLYSGVDVPHSFVDDNGQIFDCVPIEDQPSLRGGAEGPAVPPDAPPQPAPRGEAPALPVQPQLRSDRLDKFGNPMSCPPGTIPMRRVTLEELARGRTLRDFFHKVPEGTGRHPRLSPAAIEANVHKYAHAFQVVDNLGGHSFVNIWDPNIGSQVFSLSQQWYAGGSPVQTVECGSQIYPGKYGTTQPVLFIYWTADGYQNTGCYNLDCSAFTQTNSAWAIGGTLSPSSVWGGAQYEVEVTWYFSGGNWWLYLGGTTASNAVGYYRGSLFGGGQLSRNAVDIDYGGEVVDITAWPPMGSGAFASSGWQFAAYQRDVYYFGVSGGAQSASLTASQPSPKCFTTAVGHAAPPWNEYFFFGGPGGTNCE